MWEMGVVGRELQTQNDMILGEKVRGKGFRECGWVCSGYFILLSQPKIKFRFLRGIWYLFTITSFHIPSVIFFK